jgi:hypothetical protein
MSLKWGQLLVSCETLGVTLGMVFVNSLQKLATSKRIDLIESTLPFLVNVELKQQC